MIIENGWAFPDLNSLIDETSFDKNIKIISELDERDRRYFEMENALNDKNAEIVKLQLALQQLNEQKSEESARFMALTHAIHAMIPELQNDLVVLIGEMVNKVAHKVLQHELSQNDQLMPKLIQALMGELAQSELIEIEVSEEDYQKLHHIQFDTKAKWRVNAHLKPGDIVVTSEIAGIRMVLNEVINRLTSEHYEPHVE